jgi:hypothetical protein
VEVVEQLILIHQAVLVVVVLVSFSSHTRPDK